MPDANSHSINLRTSERTERQNVSRLGFVESATRRTLAERRQVDEIVIGHRLEWFSGFSPCGQSADNHERIKAPFSQHMRHPGACGFALSSAVDIDVSVLGQQFDFFIQIVRLDTN